MTSKTTSTKHLDIRCLTWLFEAVQLQKWSPTENFKMLNTNLRMNIVNIPHQAVKPNEAPRADNPPVVSRHFFVRTISREDN